jgi:hypothetical protein
MMERSGISGTVHRLVLFWRIDWPYWRMTIKGRLWHRCHDCGWPDSVLGLTVGRHEYEDGTPHIPF